jgi:hypothetical protein
VHFDACGVGTRDGGGLLRERGQRGRDGGGEQAAAQDPGRLARMTARRRVLERASGVVTRLA